VTACDGDNLLSTINSVGRMVDDDKGNKVKLYPILPPPPPPPPPPPLLLLLSREFLQLIFPERETILSADPIRLLDRRFSAVPAAVPVVEMTHDD
jgi:hypothetical protein